MEADRLGLKFNAFVAYGVGLLNFLQASFNVGVNTGLLPTKGLTLPFISYGSNSVMVAIMVCGILLRIDHENRLKAREAVSWQGS
jgi:cell division protein FtsW